MLTHIKKNLKRVQTNDWKKNLKKKIKVMNSTY